MGKTHLVCALVNRLIQDKKEESVVLHDGSIRFRSCPAFFVQENMLLARIRDTFNSGLTIEDEGYENEEMIYRELEKTPLLIIDDVGKVRPKDYSFLQGVYFRVIDSRYNEGKSIIITTNLNYDELEVHIGGACADRLREMAGKAGFIVMTGKSYRARN